MKVLLLGSSGYLGRHFQSVYPDALIPKIDAGDAAQVARVLDERTPDVVINAVGKTGRPNVDWCEEHKEETIRGNVTVPMVLLQECSKRGIYWVHLSSGCIYQGDNGGRGFTEEDAPNFSGSFYARTKAWADQMLKEFPVLVLRLRMPFDNSTHERNLIMKLRKYPRVLDAQNSLTYLPDFLDVAKLLIAKRSAGVYNVVNPGTISPHEIMELYKKFVQEDHSFQRLSLSELSQVVRAARSNCILSVKKLEGEGIVLPDVRQRAEQAIKAIASTSPIALASV